MTLNNTVYSLIINDTAGLEQQSQILTKYIDESLGFILVYSIADKRSFETVQAIYDKLIDEMNGRNVPIILIGNKTDLDGQRSVKHSEGQQLADAWKLNFLEVSAKNGTVSFKSLNHLTNHPFIHSSIHAAFFSLSRFF
jgi:small GTP-binding protein